MLDQSIDIPQNLSNHLIGLSNTSTGICFITTCVSDKFSGLETKKYQKKNLFFPHKTVECFRGVETNTFCFRLLKVICLMRDNIFYIFAYKIVLT